MSSRSTSDILWPFKCRTCHHRQIVPLEDVKDLTNFHFVYRCPNCRYLNVFEQGAVALRLSDAIEQLSGSRREEVARCIQGTPTTAYLRKAVVVFAHELNTWVGDDVPAATAALALMMRERERAMAPLFEDGAGYTYASVDIHPKIVSRVCDLLYLLLASHGVVRAPVELQSTDRTGRAFLGRFFKTASVAAGIAIQASAVDLGFWRLESRDGLLVSGKTDLNTRIEEWHLNRQEFENTAVKGKTLMDLETALSRETLEAQRLLLGFDTMAIVDILKNDFEKLDRMQAILRLNDTFRLIKVNCLDEDQAIKLQSLVLTLSRVSRFIAPFYFDLGIPRRNAVAIFEAVSRFLQANWGNYYPFYEMHDDEGNPCWATTVGPLLGAMANVIRFKNTLFQRIFELLQTADLDAVTKKRLRQIERSKSRRFEDAVATMMRDAGWKTEIRLRTWSGAHLPCGDIDLLAAKTTDGQAILLLAELKDFDLPVLSKPGAIEHLKKQLQRAFDQLEERASWTQTNWKTDLKEALFPGVKLHSAFLIPVVITARYLPPFLFERFLCLPLGAIPTFLDGIFTISTLARYKDIAKGSMIELFTRSKEVYP